MTRAEVLAILDLRVRSLRGTREGDAMADLLALAYPDAPPFPLQGFGDDLAVIRPIVDDVVEGWQQVGRLNVHGAEAFRDAARATAFVLGRAEEAALQAAS